MRSTGASPRGRGRCRCSPRAAPCGKRRRSRYRHSARHCSRSRRRYCRRNRLLWRSPDKTPGTAPPAWHCRARSAENICRRSCARKTQVRSRRRAARAPVVAAAGSVRTDRRRNWLAAAPAAPAASARRRRNRIGLRRKPGRAQEPASPQSLRQQHHAAPHALVHQHCTPVTSRKSSLGIRRQISSHGGSGHPKSNQPDCFEQEFLHCLDPLSRAPAPSPINTEVSVGAVSRKGCIQSTTPES